MRSKSLLAFFSLAFITGCNQLPSTPSNHSNENIIGKPIAEMASMNDASADQHTDIAVFDKNVRVIHEFDLTAMSVRRTLTVDSPDVPHSVLFDSATGLIADFSQSHVTLFNRDSTRYRDPVRLIGHPKSAAYDPTHGVLVVYDDMSSVALIQLDSFGTPIKTWMGDPVLQDDSTLVSGDLLADGSLVLSLSNGELAHIDVAASLAQRRWIFSTVSPGAGEFSWIAPVAGFTDRVLALSSSNTLSVVRLSDGALLASKALTNVALESKSKDAHVVTSDGSFLTAWYTDGTVLHSRRIAAPADVVLSSRLCLEQDSWTIVKSSATLSRPYFTQESEYTGRILEKFRLSDALGLAQTKIPDKTQIDVSEAYVFAMYPSSPYGYAERISTQDGSVAVIKMFNLGYIRN